MPIFRQPIVRNLLLLLLLLLTSGSMLPAHAGDGERRDRGERGDRGDRYYGGGNGQYGGNREPMQDQRQIARQERQRDVRAVQQYQPPVEQRGEPQPDRHGSRMSPEDRRALRRQIDQASHDIYAPNR